jgi:hypothetical protein
VREGGSTITAAFCPWAGREVKKASRGKKGRLPRRNPRAINSLQVVAERCRRFVIQYSFSSSRTGLLFNFGSRGHKKTGSVINCRFHHSLPDARGDHVGQSVHRVSLSLRMTARPSRAGNPSGERHLHSTCANSVPLAYFLRNLSTTSVCSSSGH